MCNSVSNECQNIVVKYINLIKCFKTTIDEFTVTQHAITDTLGHQKHSVMFIESGGMIRSEQISIWLCVDVVQNYTGRLPKDFVEQ